MPENVLSTTATSLLLSISIKSIVMSIGLPLTLFIIYRSLVRRATRNSWKKIGKDVVVVHCPTPGYYTPNVSPFVMKLLTYLRLAQIPYKLDHSDPFGSKGKTPWITINGEDLYDSQLVITALGRKFKKNFSSHLKERQLATARAFTIMVEDHLAWGLRVWRYDVDDGRTILEGMKLPFYATFLKPFFLRNQKAALWHQGFGRHAPKEVEVFVFNDLRALSRHLDNHHFFMGESLTEVDCTVFAFLANILYNYNRSPYYGIIKDNFHNLYNYVLRVKRKLWPDWNRCLETRVRRY